MVLGKVIDKRSLAVIGGSLVSFFGTAIPFLFAMQNDALAQPSMYMNVSDTEDCGMLTPMQELLLETFRMSDANCSFNITVIGRRYGN